MNAKLKKTELKVKKKAVKKVASKDVATEALKEAVLKALEDGKAENVKLIDLRGKNSMADFIVVASGTSSRHVAGLADGIGKRLKELFKVKAMIEGKSGSDWVVIDAYDLIIHLFHPEARQFYAIEEIWQ